MPQPHTPADDGPVADARRIALSELQGVGPVRAARLAQLGLHTIHDLCCTTPRKLEAWPATRAIAELLADPSTSPCVIRGSVLRWSFARFGGRSTVRCRLRDASGEVDVLFFNQPWLRHRLQKDDVLEVLGRKVEARGVTFAATRLGSADSPLPRAGEWVATYPSAEGVSQTFLRDLIERALERFGASLRENLEPGLLAAHGLPPLDRALRAVHRPSTLDEYERGLRRVALEPLLAAQRRLLASRRARASSRAFAAVVDDARFESLLASFPFALTAGQRAIAAELRAELARPQPMRRLLQGDVGSGKTVLGALACRLTAAAGAQAAFMAPTELLAEQHYAGLRDGLNAAGVSCALLTGATPERERRVLLGRLADGELRVCFGTHALLSERVAFARLALAVVDEQHRFGVAQREQLFQKGADVHGLLMTATPIPRSLALTLYGDLDVSVLREKPPGRAAVTTKWVREGERGFETAIEERLGRGEQLYWVVPRIRSEQVETDPAQELVGAEQRFERIASRRWSRWGVELVHGQLPSQERGARLERFRAGAARILVATTVIEVGVDVPAATAIVIEACERLGLAQLHQLRGRVGRGTAPSACYLLGKSSARKRLELLERSSDGFEIAEADLAQRGMGDLAGLRQAGENREGFDDDVIDLELIRLARALAADEEAQADRERPPGHVLGDVAGDVSGDPGEDPPAHPGRRLRTHPLEGRVLS